MIKMNSENAGEIAKVLNLRTVNEIRFDSASNLSKRGMEQNTRETLHCVCSYFNDIIIVVLESTNSTSKIRLDLSKGNYYYYLSDNSILIQNSNIQCFESYEFLF